MVGNVSGTRQISTEPFTADPAAGGADSGKELSPTEKPMETGLDAVRAAEEAEEISGKEAETIVDSLNDSMDKLRTRLGFKLDDKGDNIIVTVINRESDEVVRQIPSEELLQLRDRMAELTGILLNEKA